MQPEVPTIASPSQLVSEGTGEEDQLKPYGLNVDNSNPAFSQDAANQYAQQYQNWVEQPQIGAGAIQQYLGGNLGNGGSSANSTFGASYLGNLEGNAANTSYFAGQQLRQQGIENLLNQRQSFFGNDVNLAQQQNALQAQTTLGLDQIRANELGTLNSANSSGAQTLGNLAGQELGASTNAYNVAMMQNAAKAQSAANLATGGLSTLLGGANAFMGSGRSSTTPYTSTSSFMPPTAPSYNLNTSSTMPSVAPNYYTY